MREIFTTSMKSIRGKFAKSLIRFRELFKVHQSDLANLSWFTNQISAAFRGSPIRFRKTFIIHQSDFMYLCLSGRIRCVLWYL